MTTTSGRSSTKRAVPSPAVRAQPTTSRSGSSSRAAVSPLATISWSSTRSTRSCVVSELTVALLDVGARAAPTLDAEPRRGDRRLGPPLSRFLRQLVHQLDRVGIVIAGTGLDPAVRQHAFHELATGVGADDGERPVVVFADPAGRDVGVFGREVGAEVAALS